MKSVHLIVSGEVQGVFFRDSAKRKAQELGLNGYARNLSDGDVEIVAEGAEEKINELINFIKNNPGRSKVENIKIFDKTPENFKLFEIR